MQAVWRPHRAHAARTQSAMSDASAGGRGPYGGDPRGTHRSRPVLQVRRSGVGRDPVLRHASSSTQRVSGRATTRAQRQRAMCAVRLSLSRSTGPHALLTPHRDGSRGGTARVRWQTGQGTAPPCAATPGWPLSIVRRSTQAGRHYVRPPCGQVARGLASPSRAAATAALLPQAPAMARSQKVARSLPLLRPRRRRQRAVPQHDVLRRARGEKYRPRDGDIPPSPHKRTLRRLRHHHYAWADAMPRARCSARAVRYSPSRPRKCKIVRRPPCAGIPARA